VSDPARPKPAIHEHWTPTTATIPPHLNLPALLSRRVAEHPDGVFAEIKQDDGAFVPVTVRQLAEDVAKTAKGLVASGIEPGDRVLIMGHTRYEWTVADFAVLSAGAVVVPVYETSSAGQAQRIVEDAGVSLAIVETDEMAALLRPLLGAGTFRCIAVIDDGGLAELAERGYHVEDSVVRARSEACDLTTVATIVYTSGTTGTPKGVVLTHGNLAEHMIHGVDDPHFSIMIKGQDKRLLLFLPLAHAFARYIVIACLYAECVIGYVPSMKTIVDDLQAFRPTWLLAVPRVFETIYNRAELTAGGGLRHAIFRWASDIAVDYSMSLDAEGPSAWLRLRHRVARALVLDRITAIMGGHVGYAISGSAPLGIRLGHFFRGLGIIVMEGYGLTEVAAPTCVGLPGLIKIGTVGAPYPATGIRIADDGEVLVKGPNVFAGYLNDPEATAEVMTADGWFRTGDLGRLDEDGYLTIVGRKKDLIITAGGKNVQPAPLENSIRSDPLVSEVVVVGNGRPFVAALIDLDEQMVPAWLESQGIGDTGLREAARHPAVIAELQHAVDQANRLVSRAESVRAFRVTSRPFSTADGELSASQKARRTTIVEHFADEIDQLYAEELAARDRRRPGAH